MKIWHLHFELDEYDNLMPERPFTADEIQSFDGRPKKNGWRALPVKRMEPERRLELGDAPGFTIPVFSERALNCLRPIIGNSAEELELELKDGQYYAINVTAVLDVIDYPKSQYIRYRCSNRIMVFKKYAFRKCEELLSHNIFKIKDEPTRRAFVSDLFTIS